MRRMTARAPLLIAMEGWGCAAGLQTSTQYWIIRCCRNTVAIQRRCYRHRGPVVHRNRAYLHSLETLSRRSHHERPAHRDPLRRLAERELALPGLGAPAYAYEAWTRHQDTLYVSGQISRASPNQVLTGRVGDDATVADASAAAEAAVLNLLARINEAIGLANVRQVLKLNVWVSSAADFTDQPTVAEAASRLLIDVLGDAGRHARTALPTHVLPKNALVELDAIVAVKE